MSWGTISDRLHLAVKRPASVRLGTGKRPAMKGLTLAFKDKGCPPDKTLGSHADVALECGVHFGTARLKLGLTPAY